MFVYCDVSGACPCRRHHGSITQNVVVRGNHGDQIADSFVNPMYIPIQKESVWFDRSKYNDRYWRSYSIRRWSVLPWHCISRERVVNTLCRNDTLLSDSTSNASMKIYPVQYSCQVYYKTAFGIWVFGGQVFSNEMAKEVTDMACRFSGAMATPKSIPLNGCCGQPRLAPGRGERFKSSASISPGYAGEDGLINGKKGYFSSIIGFGTTRCPGLFS